MSLEITVVGALRARLQPSPDAEAGGESELQPAGMAAQLAVALARLGHTVRLVVGVQPSQCPAALRAPLVAEGITVAAFSLRDSAPMAEAKPGEQETHSEGLELHADLIDALGPLQRADAVLVQLELDDDHIIQAVESSSGAGRFTVLHASPARELDPAMLAQVDVLVATESEARVLARCLGEKVGAKGLARRLAAFGPSKVVVSRREGGALLFDGERFLELDRETGVAASDQLPSEFVFTAALLTALVQEWRVDLALRFAERAARLIQGGDGAFPKLPTSDVLETCLGGLEERST